MAKGKAVAVAGGALYLTLAAAAACPFPMREGELSLTAQVARHARCVSEELWWRSRSLVRSRTRALAENGAKGASAARPETAALQWLCLRSTAPRPRSTRRRWSFTMEELNSSARIARNLSRQAQLPFPHREGAGRRRGQG
jgi:hypothetical protein